MDEVFTTQGVADRGLELVGQSKDLIVSALDTRAGKDGDFPDVVKQLDQLTDVLRVRLDSRPTTRDENRGGRCSLLVRDVAGKGDDGDGATSNGMADGRIHDARSLLRGRNQLTVVGALHKQTVRMSLLEVAHADLDARNVRCNSQHRNLGTVGIEQTIDEVQVARPAGACTHRELTGQGRLCSGCEGRGLLVTNVYPINAALDGAARLTNRIDDRVEGVSDDAVDPPHPRIEELLDELFGNIHERDLRSTDDMGQAADRPHTSIRLIVLVSPHSSREADHRPVRSDSFTSVPTREKSRPCGVALRDS